MALVWVATAPISVSPNIRAFNRNDIVPDSVVSALSLTASGLVVQREVDVATHLPSRGVDPVTQDELDALTTGAGRLSDEKLRAAFVPFWSATETVTAGTRRLAPDGKVIVRNSDGTTRASYDATEQGLWTVVGASGLTVASVTTTAGALATGKHTPVDASGGAKTMTLPTGAAAGTQISVEKTDASVNAVTLSGNIRGSAGTVALAWQSEALSLVADGSGSWWPVASHKTKTSLDGVYARQSAADRPAGVLLTSGFDPKTRSYNLNNATLAKARAALARGLNGGKPMQIHMLGHSFLTGFQTNTPYPTNTSTAQLARLLNASSRMGVVTEGHRILSFSSQVGARLSDDARFTIGAGWVFDNTYGYAFSSVYRAPAGSGDLTFAPGVPCTHFEVIYIANAATGAWTFSTDGGSFAGTGITATNASAAYFSRVMPISPGAPGTHTLTIRPPASGQVKIMAVRAYSDTPASAVEVTNGGVSGSTAFGTNVGSWTAPIPSSAYANSLQAIDFFKPDLACIMLGINDRSAATPESDYLAAMTTLAQRVQTNGGDVVFLREPMTQPATYTDELYGVADAIGAGLIETGLDWPSVIATAKAEPYAYIGADSGHPGPRGHTNIARTIANALLPAL